MSPIGLLALGVLEIAAIVFGHWALAHVVILYAPNAADCVFGHCVIAM
jgi:hypothetical protein